MKKKYINNLSSNLPTPNRLLMILRYTVFGPRLLGTLRSTNFRRPEPFNFSNLGWIWVEHDDDDDVQNYPVFSPSTEVAGFTPFDCISIPPVSISLDPRHLPFLTPTSSLLLQLFSSMCFLADLFFFYP